MSDTTIYHNPDCGTSRNTLGLIRHAGIEPTVIEYLKTPPSKAELRGLIAAMGIMVRQLLREKGTPYMVLGLADLKWATSNCSISSANIHPDEPACRGDAPWNKAVQGLGGGAGVAPDRQADAVHQGRR
jgi:arsenate reductase (glutaredoxin)